MKYKNLFLFMSFFAFKSALADTTLSNIDYCYGDYSGSQLKIFFDKSNSYII